MAKYTVDVACYFCHTPNRVQVGADFYEQRAFYACCCCNKAVSLHITQSPLGTQDNTNIQIGHPIEEVNSNG